MGTIVAIGGGDMKNFETLAIDKYIVRLTNKKYPKVLFIPTASGDAKGYIDVFNNTYRDKLGCITDALLLINEKLSQKEIKNKILSSDIIYVGGGDTGKMLNIWHKYKVDSYLRQAYENGIILSGLSAGAICWFKYGYSDTGSNNVEGTNYACVKGLGFINAINCPHYNEEGRKEFDTMICKIKKTGIALENNCSIVFKNNTFRVLKGIESANAYKLFYENGKLKKSKLSNEIFVSTFTLLNK